MGIRNKGIFLALEEEEVVPDAVPEVEAEVPAEVEAQVAEVQEDVTEIAEMQDNVEEAVDGADELEDYVEIAESTLEEGGMDEATAQVAEVAVESIYGRLGIRRAKAMPAMEAFASPNSRVAATRIAVEDWKEKAAAIWKAIKDTFARMFASIAAFLKKIFDANITLQKSADALLKEVEAIGDKQADPAEITNMPLAKAFASGKPSEVLSAHMGLVKEAEETIAGVEAAQKKMEGVLVKLVEGEEGSVDALKQLVVESGKKLAGVWAGAEKDGLVNGTRFAYLITDSGTSMGALGAFQESVDPAASKVDGKLAVLSQDEMKKLCGEVKELLVANDRISAAAKSLSKYEASFNSMIDKAISAANNAGKSMADKVKDKVTGKEGVMAGHAEAVKSAKGVVAAFGNSMMKVYSKVPALNIKAAKAALNYVAVSLKQYKAKAAA